MIKKTLSPALSPLLFVCLLLPMAEPAWSQEKEPFSQERFESLQAGGALILLDVFADWCPTCAKQQEVLSAYQKEHPDVPLHILEIDFDDQKQWVKAFRAPRQSTLILYRGEEQLWFGVAETDPEVIFAELNKAAAHQ